MVAFTYIPGPEDPHETEIMRVHFTAGTPTQIDEESEMGALLVFKLRANPWFHEGDGAPDVGPSPTNKKAAELRDQARALWVQAWNLDPKGTEADVSPPQYAIDLQRKPAAQPTRQRKSAAKPPEEVISEQHDRSQQEGASDASSSAATGEAGDPKEGVQGLVPPGA